MRKHIAKPKKANGLPKRERKTKGKLFCSDEWQGLRQRCLASICSFENDAPRFDTPIGPYYFRDNGSDILAVAHLDTIQHHRHFGCLEENRDRIYNCQLDDRLGAWIILDLLPSMDIETDILLTTGEESGMSTASRFTTPKEYNWIVEFDRSGTDVVTYDMESDEWLILIQKERKVGRGSYSDISELNHFGVCAANWGIGYYRNHSLASYFNVSELVDTIERFHCFFNANSGFHFPIEKTSTTKIDEFDYDEFWKDYQDEQTREHERWKREQERKYSVSADADSVYSLNAWEH